MRTRLSVLLVLAVGSVLAWAFIVAAQGAPSRVTDLRAERSGDGIILTWTHTDGAVDHYEVWRSDRPYANVGDASIALPAL